MGNGNIDVGTKAPTRRSGRPIVENLAGTKERPSICGAMAQQCGDFGRGNQSAPQKFLQLVGCRDPNARPVPWVRPRPAPVKR